jgi:hypothetical protein
VWGSNPPAAPLGASTLVLKTRRAAGPLALPRQILSARRTGPTRDQRRVSVKVPDTLPQQTVPAPVACPL